MHRILILLFLFAVSQNSLQAQELKKLYYNEDGKECSSEKASFYRIIKFINNNPVGKVYDYYITGELKEEYDSVTIKGSLDSSSINVFGELVIYRQDGKKMYDFYCNIFSGEVEVMKSFHENGNIWSSTVFSNDKKIFETEYSDEGKILSETPFLYNEIPDTINQRLYYYDDSNNVQEILIGYPNNRWDIYGNRTGELISYFGKDSVITFVDNSTYRPSKPNLIVVRGAPDKSTTVEYIRAKLISVGKPGEVSEVIFDERNCKMTTVSASQDWQDIYWGNLDANTLTWDIYEAGNSGKVLKLSITSRSGLIAMRSGSSYSRAHDKPSGKNNQISFLFSISLAADTPNFQERIMKAFQRLIELCGGQGVQKDPFEK